MYKRTQRIDLPWLLTITGLMMVLLSLALLFDSTPVRANSEEMDLPGMQYPAINGSRIDHCTFCHTPDGMGLNAYGEDYMAQGGHKTGPAAFTAIEQLDSDGDGVSNIEEIIALTNPGDSADQPFETYKLPEEMLPQLPVFAAEDAPGGGAGARMLSR